MSLGFDVTELQKLGSFFMSSKVANPGSIITPVYLLNKQLDFYWIASLPYILNKFCILLINFKMANQWFYYIR